jgi:hypothetical protein
LVYQPNKKQTIGMLQDPFAQRVVIDNTACGVQKDAYGKMLLSVYPSVYP